MGKQETLPFLRLLIRRLPFTIALILKKALPFG